VSRVKSNPQIVLQIMNYKDSQDLYRPLLYRRRYCKY